VYAPVCSFQETVSMEVARDVRELESMVGMNTRAEMNIIIGTATGEFGYDFGLGTASSHVFIVFRGTAKNCSYRLREPVFRSAGLLSMYQESYGDFRERFGDRFANVVTTGGNFLAIIAIDAGEARLRFGLAMALKLEIGSMVFKLGWRRAFSRIVGRYHRHNVQVSVNGDRWPVTTPAEVWTAYGEFIDTLASDDCTGPLGFQRCPYRIAKFESYEALAPAPADRWRVRRGAEFLRAIQDRREILRRLRQQMDHVQAMPELFRLEDSASGRLDVLSRVETLRGRLERLDEDLATAGEDCRRDPHSTDHCQPLTFSFFDVVLELELALPRGRPPRNCREIRLQRNVQENGAFTVYMDGDGSKPYAVYCEGMDGEAPQTYLRLYKTSPPSRRPRFNFCSLVDGRTIDGERQERYVARVFDAVLVREVEEGRLMVEADQAAHTATRGGEDILLADRDGASVPLPPCQYGRGMILGSTGHERLVGNVDLGHTPFVVDDNSSWRLSTRLAGEQLREQLSPVTAAGQGVELRLPPGEAERRDLTVHHGPSRQPVLVLRYAAPTVEANNPSQPAEPEEL
jgi:hypothetical protein